MESKAGVKSSEFWVVVLSQVLTLFKTFFPDANIDPSGQGTTIVTGIAAIYAVSRTALKIFEAKYIGHTKAQSQAVVNSLAGSKAFKFILVGTLAMSLISCTPKKQIISEGTIYQALQGVSAGYGFAHTAITKFAELARQQIDLSCPKDPGGVLCKSAQSFKQFYEDTLQPGSQEITDKWKEATEAFDIYRNLDNPTESDATDVLAKIEKVQELIQKLKALFAGVKFVSGPVAFDAVRELDYANNVMKQMKVEVLNR